MLPPPVPPVAPAWRPGAPHTLAWVGARGRVEVRDVDSGRARVALGRERRRGDRAGVVGRRAPAPGARRPARRRLRRDGDALPGACALPHGARVGAAAWAPRGDRIALALRGGAATSRVYVTRSAPGAAAARCSRRGHAGLAGVVAERRAPARPLGRGRPMAAALPRRRECAHHRHRLDLPPLRSPAHGAGLVLRGLRIGTNAGSHAQISLPASAHAKPATSLSTHGRQTRRVSARRGDRALASRQHGVIAARQLAALGLARVRVARRGRAGRLHRVHRGVYAVGRPGSPRTGVAWPRSSPPGRARR